MSLICIRRRLLFALVAVLKLYISFAHLSEKLTSLKKVLLEEVLLTEKRLLV